jgi:hypothetical protein
MKDFNPKIFDLKVSSKTISNITTIKIIDQILNNLSISDFLKEIRSCLKDMIKPIIKMNFKTLGNDNR